MPRQCRQLNAGKQLHESFFSSRLMRSGTRPRDRAPTELPQRGSCPAGRLRLGRSEPPGAVMPTPYAPSAKPDTSTMPLGIPLPLGHTVCGYPLFMLMSSASAAAAIAAWTTRESASGVSDSRGVSRLEPVPLAGSRRPASRWLRCRQSPHKNQCDSILRLASRARMRRSLIDDGFRNRLLASCRTTKIADRDRLLVSYFRRDL